MLFSFLFATLILRKDVAIVCKMKYNSKKLPLGEKNTQKNENRIIDFINSLYVQR